MYDDYMAQNKYINTVFSLKQFVVYRLCPTDQCDYCGQNYGEYVLEIGDYLSNVVDHQREAFEKNCEECDRNGNNDNRNKCKICKKVVELEDAGYVDASTLTTCQQIELDGNDDDQSYNNRAALYVGPRCSKGGSMVRIDVFSDNKCTQSYGVNVEDVLGHKLHYYVLQYALGGSCANCAEEEEERNEKDDKDEEDREKDKDENKVLDFCENVYAASAKCETKHGFRHGESSITNEYDICTFIDSLVWNSYDQKGEIAVNEPQDIIVRQTTTLQRMMLVLISFSGFTLAIYGNYLQKKIQKYTNMQEEKLLRQTSPKSVGAGRIV